MSYNKGVRKSRPRSRRLNTFFPKRKDERRRVQLLGGAALGLFLVVIVGAFSATGLQQLALRSSSVAAVVSAILVDLANVDRSTHGLANLTVNPKLVAVAQAKANDMAAKGYFSHVSPDGVEPWHWFRQEGYAYTFAGENLAVDFSDSGDVERAWMNSPTHRDNILNAKFTEIGIATAQGIYQGRATTFVVQVFAVPVNTTTVTAPPEAEESTEVAIAPSEDVQVLGTITDSADTPPAKSMDVVTKPQVAATISEKTSSDIPWWGYLVSFPRDTLKYAYYFVGLLILVAFAIETGLEMRAHHTRKAIHIGALFALMAALFFVADYAFFAEPVLAKVF